MTKVIERRENEVTDFIIDGHAEKVNPDEGNILCAAVSMLGQTLLDCLWRMDANVRTESRDGHIAVRLYPDDENSEEIENLLKFTKTGFCLLKSKYPEQFDLVGDFEF